MKRLSGMATRLWSSNQELHEEFKRNGVEDTVVAILGARGSGKTTFLYRLYFKQSEQEEETPFEVIPTENHNVEVIAYSDYQLQMWDFAEFSFLLEQKRRTHVLIHVIDGVVCGKSLEERVKPQEDMAWLLKHLSHQLQDTLIVTVVNKCDVEGSVDAETLTEAWQQDSTLINLLRGHDWKAFDCSALAGHGLDTVLAYITHQLGARNMAALRLHEIQQRRSICGSPSFQLPSALAHTPTITARSPRVESRRWSSMSAENYRKDFQPAAKLRLPVTPWEDIPNPYHLEDHEFILRFRCMGTFLYFDHCTHIRAIYLTLKRQKGDIVTGTKANSLSTRRLLHNLCAILRDIELQVQDDGPIQTSIEYSETHTLFWIYMVSFALLRHPILEGEDASFETFLTQCRELQNAEAWRDYYSPRIFTSERAKREFIPPDRKPFPNAFKPAALALKGSGLSIDYQIL